MHEEEWSYIPVGGPLPLPEQPMAAFGAAANLVHPATGYSLTRSLREAPAMAAAVKAALDACPDSAAAAAQVWGALWSPEKRRQVGAALCWEDALHVEGPAGLGRAGCTVVWPKVLACADRPLLGLNAPSYSNVPRSRPRRRPPSTCLAWSSSASWTSPTPPTSS